MVVAAGSGYNVARPVRDLIGFVSASASPVNAPDSLPFGYVAVTFLGFLALSHRYRPVSG